MALLLAFLGLIQKWRLRAEDENFGGSPDPGGKQPTFDEQK